MAVLVMFLLFPKQMLMFCCVDCVCDQFCQNVVAGLCFVFMYLFVYVIVKSNNLWE